MIFPIHSILFLNMAVAAVLLLFLWSGYRRGFLMKLLDCFSTVILAFLSWLLSGWIAPFLKLVPTDAVTIDQPDIAATIYEPMNRVCVFAVLFLCVWLLVMIAKPLFKTISSLPILQGINKLLGLVFGALQTIIVLIVVVFVMQTPLFANGEYVIANSYLKPIAQAESGILENLGSSAKDLKALQKIVTPNSTVDKEDDLRIRTWLQKQGVDQQSIDEFMNEVIGN